MKESWAFYDYIRRWWWLFLLGPIIGGLAGLTYYQMNAGPPLYHATMIISVSDQTPPFDDKPQIVASVTSGPLDSEDSAVEFGQSTLEWVGNYINSPLVDNNLLISRREYVQSAWKGIILGSIVATLMTIGAIYVWEDTAAYLWHRRQST